MKVSELISILNETNQDSEVILSISDFEHEVEWSTDEPVQVVRENLSRKEVELVGGRIK